MNVAKNANSNESLNTDLAYIFTNIEASASGFPSERDIKGLFANFDTTNNRLGNTVKDKNARLATVLKGLAELCTSVTLQKAISICLAMPMSSLFPTMPPMPVNPGASSSPRSIFPSRSRSSLCTGKLTSTRFMIQPVALAHYYCKLKSTLMLISSEMVFWARDQPHHLQPGADEHVIAQHQLRQVQHLARQIP